MSAMYAFVMSGAHCCSDMTCNVKTHEAIPVCRSDDMKVTEISLLRVKREGQLAHMLPNRGHQPLDADSIFPLIQFRVATTNEELTHGHTETCPVPLTCLPSHRCLRDAGLQGSLPAEWSGLSALRLLVMADNNFTGPLPGIWSSLGQLQLADLSNNSLTGTLPEAWSSLRSMHILYLYRNKLKGALRNSWSTLSRLKYLVLHDNGLTGTLPNSWSNLSQLESRKLSANSL
eukprot:jgi/Botrbrau1/14340/Bobra.0222s0010.1